MKKRTTYINWNQYFFNIAILSSLRSKDPNTQVGACIVGKDNRIKSIGYNGTLNNISDDLINWNNDKNATETKYFYIVHAEVNAILNAKKTQFKQSRIYITHFPCNDCAKIIIQAGIYSVYYLNEKVNSEIEHQNTLKLFNLAKIEVKKIEIESIKINQMYPTIT